MPPSLYASSSGRSNTESNFTECEVVTCAMPGVVTNSISSPSSLKNPRSRATSTGRSCTAFIVATFGRVFTPTFMLRPPPPAVRARSSSRWIRMPVNAVSEACENTPMANPDRFLLAGVMGWPVMHSRSPLLHNYWFKQHDLAGTYVPLAIAPAMLAAALRALHPLGFAGCNLTLPHKQAAMAVVDEADALAKSIGAISCVIARPDGSLTGTNNDCYGFIQNLRHSHPGWRADAGPAVVIGAGGGARAVCYGLAQDGAREIRVINRSLARAQEIANDFGGP